MRRRRKYSLVEDKDSFSIIQIAKTIGLTSIRYQSDAKVSDRYLIDIDPMVFAICVISRWQTTMRITSNL